MRYGIRITLYALIALLLFCGQSSSDTKKHYNSDGNEISAETYQKDSIVFEDKYHQARGLRGERECRAFSDRLMKQFADGEFNEGLNSAKPYWPLPEVEIDGMANQIKQQWPMVNQRFGRAVSIEFIREKRIGKSFLRYYYLHKFENHAIYWQIDYYRPREEWKINKIIFLDSLDDLFE